MHRFPAESSHFFLSLHDKTMAVFQRPSSGQRLQKQISESESRTQLMVTAVVSLAVILEVVVLFVISFVQKARDHPLVSLFAILPLVFAAVCIVFLSIT